MMPVPNLLPRASEAGAHSAPPTARAGPANMCIAARNDTRVIRQSPGSRALFGELSSIADQFIDPTDCADLLVDFDATGAIDNRRANGRRHDGTAFPALFSLRGARFNGEEVLVFRVMDLTDERAATDALEHASKRMRDAIESLDEGFALYDAAGRLQLWNRQYDALNQPTAGVLRQGLRYDDLCNASIGTGELTEEGERLSKDATRPTQVPRRFEIEYRDGRWYSIARSPTSDGGFVITKLDITERKRAEALERDLDSRIRSVLDACPIAFTMTRAANGELVYRGGAADDLYGPNTHGEQYWIDPAERAQYLERLERTGRVDGMEVRLRRENGSAVPTLISARRTAFRGEEMTVAYMYDLTERTAMEAELAAHREMLHQSEKLSALGELLAGVAHELNNPLSVVVGHA
ncbi:MAG: PAS-domain containing protein, partial [Pseudomonadota bacterium]